MGFENLRLFRDIAQSRSLTRAAEANGITPSAASQQVNELERILGATLLDRSTRPLSLTTEGKLYHELCRDVLRRDDEFRAELDQLRTNVEGNVRVAAIYSVGLSDMSQVELEFARRHPNVKVEIEYLRPEKVYEYVLADRVDLGLVSYPEASRELAVVPWREEKMVVAASPGHFLMSRSSIHPADLDGTDFVTFDEDLPIAREIDRYLRINGVEVNATARFDNIQTIKEALMIGARVSIIPARMLQVELEQGRLAAVPLVAPGLVRPVGIVHRKKRKLHRAVQAFVQLLQEKPSKGDTRGVVVQAV